MNFHIGLVSAYPTAEAARQSFADPVGEYRGVWWAPTPEAPRVHLFSDASPEELAAHGFQLVPAVFTAADIDPLTNPMQWRVYSLIYSGLTEATRGRDSDDSWMRLSERTRIAKAIYAKLAAGNIEFRIGPLANLADIAAQEAWQKEKGTDPA